MAILVTTYQNFNKRRNSTKVPSGGTDHNCTLKQPTSVEHPVFILDNTNFSTNYIKAFDNYYFVDDMVILNPEMAEFHCTMDPLASNRSAILNSSQYVLRTSDDSFFNTSIIDTAYPKVITPNIKQVKASGTPFITTSNAGLVLGVKGNNGSAFWALRIGLFDDLGRALFGTSQDDLWDAIGAVNLDKTYLDPMQYITSGVIIPIDTASMTGSSSSSIKIGYWTFTDPDGAQIYKALSDRVVYRSGDLILSVSPKSVGINNFKNSNQFRRYTLTLPGAGTVELDADTVLQNSSVHVAFAVDVTGAIAYDIKMGPSWNIHKYVSGYIGIPYAIHGQTIDLSKTAGAGLDVVGGIVSGASAGAAAGTFATPIGTAAGAVIGGIAGGILSAGKEVTSAGPLYNVSSSGSDGSMAGIAMNKDIILTETIYETSDTGYQRLGAPCYKYLTLGNIRGYVVCQNASLNMPGYGPEKTEIESILNTGVYIE